MNEIVHKKQQIRVIAKELLSKKPKDWFKSSSKLVSDNLKTFLAGSRFDGSTAILSWIPHFTGEVDLVSSINSFAPENFSVFCPRCSASGELIFFQMPSELVQGSFGISEPKDDPTRQIKFNNYKNLICLVPGLAFDRHGGRLGRGKGIYDMFLSEASSKIPILKIGVCWSFQVFASIPCEEHDQKMNFILNEQEILEV